jgi:HSP20 family protein
MANTEIRKPNASPVQRPLDIFGAMRDEMDRIFDRFSHGWPNWPGSPTRGLANAGMVPDLDVHDDGKQLTIEADLPGVEEKDVSLTLNNGVLSIKGEKKSSREEKKADYYLSERSYGSFERALRLPETVDEGSLKASFDKGVLKIVAQKKPEAVKSEKRIEISKG